MSGLTAENGQLVGRLGVADWEWMAGWRAGSDSWLNSWKSTTRWMVLSGQLGVNSWV